MENVEHPVQRSTAPWELSAESYFLFLRLKELPQGLYDRLEEVWGDDALGSFEGGLGAIMIVRYTNTPVGRSILFFVIDIFVTRQMSMVPCFKSCSRFTPANTFHFISSHDCYLVQCLVDFSSIERQHKASRNTRGKNRLVQV